MLRNRQITVSITPGEDWSYSVNDTDPGCATPADCVIKTVAGSAFNGTILTSEFTSLTFDGTQGTITDAVGGTIGVDTILVGNSTGKAGVKPMPISVKLCAPSTDGASMGYPSC
ncbi:hypothetical protein GO608_009205 [Aromatoleum buckelii]|nr:hypothetical protein [Aromatoleum buckelii]